MTEIGRLTEQHKEQTNSHKNRVRYAATNASRFVGSVYCGVSISNQLEMPERQNLELKDGRHYWKKNDGNCEVFSISSDLGFLTTCQKTSAYKSMCVCIHAHIRIHNHDSCLCNKLGCNWQWM